jgi:hypothetical protein
MLRVMRHQAWDDFAAADASSARLQAARAFGKCQVLLKTNEWHAVIKHCNEAAGDCVSVHVTSALIDLPPRLWRAAQQQGDHGACALCRRQGACAGRSLAGTRCERSPHAVLQLEEFEDAVRAYQRGKDAKGDDHEANEGHSNAAKLLKMSKRKDYYKILGVDKSASEQQIKKAYVTARTSLFFCNLGAGTESWRLCGILTSRATPTRRRRRRRSSKRSQTLMRCCRPQSLVTSHVTRRTSRVTRHASHVTRLTGADGSREESALRQRRRLERAATAGAESSVSRARHLVLAVT